MRLTVLADNNSLIDRYFLAEPAVSYFIEDGDVRLLLDVGYSDVFIQNAATAEVDLSTVSTIVISHGHNDHTRGFKFLKDAVNLKGVRVVAHPDAFKPRAENGVEIGSPFSTQELAQICCLSLSKTPLSISEKLIFLGEIPTLNTFEARTALGAYTEEDGSKKDDFVMDDSALVYKGKDGLFIITGCSHSGICNIIEYATQVCNEPRVAGVIGGFHLFETSSRLTQTIDYLKKKNIYQLYPCHCVSFAAKSKIHQSIPIQEVGVGMSIEVA